jgi:hypothetical protein
MRKTSELKFQQQIIDDVRESNRESYAVKINQRFVAGFPDLFIKHPDYDPLFVEAKLGHLNREGFVKIDTTPIQRNTLKNMERSGLTVAVWTLVQDQDMGDFILQSHWRDTMVEVKSNIVVYRIHRSWPVKRLLEWPIGVIS